MQVCTGVWVGQGWCELVEFDSVSLINRQTNIMIIICEFVVCTLTEEKKKKNGSVYRDAAHLKIKRDQ